jgi:hypothetical protein
VTAKLPERIKRALDAYNDVVIAWHLNVSVDEVDNRYEQLVAAIAEHVAPVDAPTEAEIEAWEQRARDLLKSSGLRVRATLIREDGTPTGEELDSPPLAYVLMLREAVALMRRAAAATPAPSALERLRERLREQVDRANARHSPNSMFSTAAFDRVLDWIDEEREREAKR